MVQDTIRSAAQDGRLLFNGWAMLGSAHAVEVYGQAGWDTITLDMQHGAIGHESMVACLTAAQVAGLPGLVRVADNNPGLIGAALDGGAQGVICPMINSGADAERLIDAVKYPPRGKRSWGPYRAKPLIEGNYFEGANGWTVACAQIETGEALENINDILAVDGLDMVLAGPNDLAITLTGAPDIFAAEVVDALDLILKKAKEASVMTAVFANDIDFARPLSAAGWDMLTVGTDGGLLGAAAGDVIAQLRRD